MVIYYFIFKKQNLYISKWLPEAKKRRSVLFISPTNTPFDRFNMLVQVNSCDNFYKKIQNLFQMSVLGKGFSLEQ